MRQELKLVVTDRIQETDLHILEIDLHILEPEVVIKVGKVETDLHLTEITIDLLEEEIQITEEMQVEIIIDALMTSL